MAKYDLTGVAVNDLGDDDEYQEPLVPGDYQFLISEVNDSNERYIIMTCEILAGTNPEMAGKEYRQFISNRDSEGSKKRLLIFATAFGLTTQKKLKELQAKGEDIEIDWHLARGKTFFGRLEETTWEGRKQVQIEWKVWRAGSKAAKHIPQIESVSDEEENPFAGL